MKNKIKRTGIIWGTEKTILKEIVDQSDSIADILRRLGMKSTCGTNYQELKDRLKKDNIDYTQVILKQKESLKNRFINNLVNKKTLDEILMKNSTYPRGHLKIRLLKEGLLKNKCSICGMHPEWNGKTLVMVLDHINGVNNDNRLENLRLLCPNCNSQQATFSGRNIKSKKKSLPQCKKCNKKISKKSKNQLCLECYHIFQQKVKNRPSKEELQEMINTMSWLAIGRKYGVSDNAVRKWARKYKIMVDIV